MCIVEYPYPLLPTQTNPNLGRMNNWQWIWPGSLPEGLPTEPLVPGDYPFEPKKWILPDANPGTSTGGTTIVPYQPVVLQRFQVKKIGNRVTLTLDLPGVKPSGLRVKIKTGRQLVVTHTRFDRNDGPQSDTYSFEHDIDPKMLHVTFEACVLTICYEERVWSELDVDVSVKDV